jgi:transcriptional regulator with XRE-family HTH domain
MLGELLQSRREAAGLTQAEMAAELGVSRPYLSRLEHGTYDHPSPRVIMHIARRLEIRAEDLLAMTGCLIPTDLPSFAPYLRAKHPDWPQSAITELDDFYQFVKQKHSLR